LRPPLAAVWLHHPSCHSCFMDSLVPLRRQRAQRAAAARRNGVKGAEKPRPSSHKEAILCPETYRPVGFTQKGSLFLELVMINTESFRAGRPGFPSQLRAPMVGRRSTSHAPSRAFLGRQGTEGRVVPFVPMVPAGRVEVRDAKGGSGKSAFEIGMPCETPGPIRKLPRQGHHQRFEITDPW